MANTRAFDENAKAYDDWFEDHKSFYESELEAIRSNIPTTGKGIEIGVGTGRFAEPLGIKVGIEPSPTMRAIARERGINAIDGVAEKLPIESETFDYVLFVTTICFLDSLNQAFSEAFRILKPKGIVVIGFIEKESTLGRIYQQRKAERRFYREANFHTVGEIIRVLETTGLTDFSFVQTLFSEEGETGAVQPLKEGYGDGAFVVVRAKKPDNV
jgi:SAM-dependent methyltransferase